MSTDQQPHTYEWAVDALLEVLRLLNAGQPENVEKFVRQVVWEHATPKN